MYFQLIRAYRDLKRGRCFGVRLSFDKWILDGRFPIVYVGDRWIDRFGDTVEGYDETTCLRETFFAFAGFVSNVDGDGSISHRVASFLISHPKSNGAADFADGR